MILVVISIRMTCWIRVSWLTLPTECMHNWIGIPLHVILSSIRKSIYWSCIFMMWWDSTITHSCVHVHMASCITGFLATVHVERILFKRDIKLLFCISTLVLGYYRSNYEHSSVEYWSALCKSCVLCFHSNLHEHSPIHLPLNAVLYVNRFCIHQRDSHQYNMVASQRIAWYWHHKCHAHRNV